MEYKRRRKIHFMEAPVVILKRSAILALWMFWLPARDAELDDLITDNRCMSAFPKSRGGRKCDVKCLIQGFNAFI